MLACQCFMASIEGKKPIKSLLIKNVDHEEELKEARGESTEQLESIPLREVDPTKMI